MPTQSSSLMASTFRRASTTPDVGSSNGESSQRPDAPETARRSSIANLSLRLTRSKKSQSSRASASLWHLEKPEEKTNRLGELFFRLPSEIQSQVLCYLDLNELFNVRRTSKSAVDIVNGCSSSVTRTILSDLSSPSDSQLLSRLYPMPTSCRSTSYLLQMLHRNNTITRMIKVIITFIQMKIYMIKTGPRVEHFAQYRNRLATILYPGAWVVHHFLESYRHRLIYIHPKHDQSRFWGCPECATATTEMVNSYPRDQLIPAYQFFALTLLHLRASSRAPTYAGTLERRLRGWSRKAAGDDDLAQLVILGGLEQLSRISVMRGTYNQRLELIHKFLDKLRSTTSSTSFQITFDSDGNKHVREMKAPDFMTEVDIPFGDITESVIENLPSLSDILMPEFQRRILEEGLVEDEEELDSPFKFVQGVMVDEDETEGDAQWQYHVFSNYGPQLATGRVSV